MIICLLSAITLCPALASLQSEIVARATAFEIPLKDGTHGSIEWGDADRTADHATVAINNSRHILVAYHSTRDDITDTVGQQQGFHEPIKQVEIAFFEYDIQNDEWDLVSQKLLGSTEHDPKNSAEQNAVRCERPDVIAVGELFFVVWTRRYDRAQPGFEQEPAILECAWIEWSGSNLIVHDGFQSLDGLGFVLDDDYWVRECAGVPDAVLLDPGGTNTLPTVGVVYPHQSDFGDALDGNDNERRCDLRLIVTTFDPGTSTLDVVGAPVTLVDDLVFDGPTAPSGQVAAGLILPDCARGQPDPQTDAYRFWLAYEEQFKLDNSAIPDGRIRLELWEQADNGDWDTLATVNFGAAGNPHARRRPMLSSYPEDAGGLEVVSIAFSKTNTTNNDDVVHDQWRYEPEEGLYKLIPPFGHAFQNDGDDHTRPVPLHGRTTPLVRRLYVDRNESVSQVLEYDMDSDDTTVKCGSDFGLGRPAAAYHAGSGSVPDDFVLAWEERQENETFFRIWLRVD